MDTLWQKEEFERICTRESITEKAAETEKTISVKEHEKCHSYEFGPTILRKSILESEAGWHSD